MKEILSPTIAAMQNSDDPEKVLSELIKNIEIPEEPNI